MLVHIFGSLAMIMGMSTFIFGLTAQVYKQYKEKRCGLSIVFATLGTTTCAVRITYFALAEAWWTIPPDIIGLIISVAIIYQYGLYERNWWGNFHRAES